MGVVEYVSCPWERLWSLRTFLVPEYVSCFVPLASHSFPEKDFWPLSTKLNHSPSNSELRAGKFRSLNCSIWMNLFNQYCSHEWILHMQGDGKETWICFQQKGPRKKPHAPKHTLQNMRHFAPELQKTTNWKITSISPPKNDGLVWVRFLGENVHYRVRKTKVDLIKVYFAKFTKLRSLSPI